MRDKLNQFIDNLNGQFVEVSSKTALYQCMDLAYTWVFALGFPKATIQNASAYQVFTAPKPITFEYFDLITNSPTAIPQDGDLVVWSDKYGPAGHIAIALSGGTTSKFRCFEQNNPTGTNAHIQERPYTHVLGWLRPKVKEQADEFKWFKGLLTENGINLADAEGRTREIFDQAKKYVEAINGRDRALRDLAEARGDATKFEELHVADQRALREKDDELARRQTMISDRDSTITSLRQQLADVGSPVVPQPKGWITKLLDWLSRK